MAMYMKNLNQEVKVRLTDNDYDFLQEEAERRSCSVSEVIRQMIGEYRRSLTTMDVLKKALEMAEKGRLEELNGNTETDIND